MTEEKHHLLPLSLHELRARRKPIKNANAQQSNELTGLDKLALYITDHVGTMGFFLLIFGWTVIWCGYNILASEIPALHWASFDPFPAFVAYLLISNVVQILLMPLIMVGQNLQGRHSEIRAENDFEINTRAEAEVETILKHLELQNAVLQCLAEQQGIKQDAILKMLAERNKDAAPSTS